MDREVFRNAEISKKIVFILVRNGNVYNLYGGSDLVDEERCKYK